MESIVPTLALFEDEFLKIFLEAEEAQKEFYKKAASEGNIGQDGLLKDVASVGCTKMYLKKRDKLYKWLLGIANDANKIYFVHEYDGQVSISFRHLIRDQSYMLNRALNEILANRLREKFGWEIFNTVDID